ncbi:hypothetical protein PT7_0229 [Pusillimonas sp. T7-7]|nr:hypothetical protein PT7_0229 [Pusillimonas sp. T7-7]
MSQIDEIALRSPEDPGGIARARRGMAQRSYQGSWTAAAASAAPGGAKPLKARTT